MRKTKRKEFLLLILTGCLVEIHIDFETKNAGIYAALHNVQLFCRSQSGNIFEKKKYKKTDDEGKIKKKCAESITNMLFQAPHKMLRSVLLECDFLFFFVSVDFVRSFPSISPRFLFFLVIEWHLKHQKKQRRTKHTARNTRKITVRYNMCRLGFV